MADILIDSIRLNLVLSVKLINPLSMVSMTVLFFKSIYPFIFLNYSYNNISSDNKSINWIYPQIFKLSE